MVLCSPGYPHTPLVAQDDTEFLIRWPPPLSVGMTFYTTPGLWDAEDSAGLCAHQLSRSPSPTVLKSLVFFFLRGFQGLELETLLPHFPTAEFTIHTHTYFPLFLSSFLSIFGVF